MPMFDDADWLEHFRMRKTDFDQLVEDLWSDMNDTRMTSGMLRITWCTFEVIYTIDSGAMQQIETEKKIAIGIYKLAWYMIFDKKINIKVITYVKKIKFGYNKISILLLWSNQFWIKIERDDGDDDRIRYKRMNIPMLGIN